MTALQAPNRKFRFRIMATGAISVALLALGGCSMNGKGIHNPIHIKHHRVLRTTQALPPSNMTTIGVNAYLWRATLDTVSFMPIASADPFGGTVLTDWYSAPEHSEERSKLNVFVLSRELRADGVRVRMFKQQRNEKGNWADTDVAPAVTSALEETILTRARQMKLAQKDK